jgi:hypoxanthine phosphoribosyltransferase
VREIGRQIGRDYEDLEPLLVAPLKASLVFLADLSRAVEIPHGVDFVELASYASGADTGGHARIRLLKDLDHEIADRHVLIVEDVIDTGLTLNYLCKTLALRNPASLAAVTLLDRPYRRLVEDLPVRYVGFTVPDELFVGYGFDLQEQYRNLPDLHVLRA